MYLLGKNAAMLKAEDIIRLIDNQIPESKSLDYKKDLSYSTNGDKKEFLFDIAAMANTGGGCLVYGIEEAKDDKNQNTGLPGKITGIEGTNQDKTKQQIEDIIRSNTDPGISNIVLNYIPVGSETVLVIGILKAYGLPVMVTAGEANKFYRRKNTGKYPVGTSELNNMFLQNQVLKANAANWVDTRIEKVLNMKALPVLNTDFPFFMHVIPYDFMDEKILDFTTIPNEVAALFRPVYCGGWDYMYNVDGYASFGKDPDDRQRIVSYDQLFRNGIYESYTGRVMENFERNNGKDIITLDGYEFIKTVTEKVRSIFSIFKKMKVEPPFILFMNMYNIKGAAILADGRFTNPFLCNEVSFPSIIFQSFDKNVEQKLKGLFTILWQAAGQHNCPEIVI